MGTSTHRLEFDSHGHLPMNLGQRSRTLSTDVVPVQVDAGEGRVDRQRLRHHGVKCLLRIACWPNAYKTRWQIKCNICRAETSALGTAIGMRLDTHNMISSGLTKAKQPSALNAQCTVTRVPRLKHKPTHA